MIRIIVVDDHPIVRRGLRQLLSAERDMTVAGEAANAQDMLALLRVQPCDALVMDVSMPGRSGLEALKELKEEHPKLPILMLSMHPEDPYGVRALKLGASGYMSKDAAADELIGAIRKIVGGRKYISDSLAERLAMSLAIDTSRPAYELLSVRERQVLGMLATGRSLTQIARELSVSVQTISTYRARVMEKTELHSNEQLIHYAITNNLAERFVPSSSARFSYRRISPPRYSGPRSASNEAARQVGVAAAA